MNTVQREKARLIPGGQKREKLHQKKKKKLVEIASLGVSQRLLQGLFPCNKQAGRRQDCFQASKTAFS